MILLEFNDTRLIVGTFNKTIMSRFLKVYPSKKRRKKIITNLGYTQYIKKWLDWSFGSCCFKGFVFVSHMKGLDLMPQFLPRGLPNVHIFFIGK